MTQYIDVFCEANRHPECMSPFCECKCHKGKAARDEVVKRGLALTFIIRLYQNGWTRHGIDAFTKRNWLVLICDGDLVLWRSDGGLCPTWRRITTEA